MLAEHRAQPPEGDPALDLEQLAGLLDSEHSAVVAIESPQEIRRRGSARPELVAAAGLTRAHPSRRARRARLWGVFVEECLRGRGLGRAVAGAALDLARTWHGLDFVELSVAASAPEAARLYASLGFEPWGGAPEALRAGQRSGELYMTLRL